ncbi:hypothetical protein HU675_0042210 [Bradyrhizobium septentrionale]|uniref:hypothetical protein n=1 Tax=Bradyrhizobium septentrionale TaxID=1404411 RepID=UPI001596FE23|nr:hypothetical protein [Bradyrhizobium septentrionale]UGY24455.1 hypothetical protein HU675_0042210 [Bradyrhizobium septentrionale]
MPRPPPGVRGEAGVGQIQQPWFAKTSMRRRRQPFDGGGIRSGTPYIGREVIDEFPLWRVAEQPFRFLARQRLEKSSPGGLTSHDALVAKRVGFGKIGNRGGGKRHLIIQNQYCPRLIAGEAVAVEPDFFLPPP